MARSLRIGLSFDFDEKQGYLLKEDYLTALTQRGVEVIPLFFEQDSLTKKLEACDGVVIPGGLKDLHPQKYGEKTVHPKTQLNPKREAFDWALAIEILRLDKPCLAICWGFQLFNVFLGGSLYQHLPEQKPSEIPHEQVEDSHIATHRVIFEKESWARSLMNVKEIEVNSTHHQGVKELASDLICEGRADDGLIEAYRHRSQAFLYGVEWHPERLKDDPFIPFFLEKCRQISS